MLDPSPETMHKAVDSVSRRLEDLKMKLQQRGKLSDANQASLDQIQQHQHRLATKLADTERKGTWGFAREEFAADWNSLLADLDTLENVLYE